MDAVIQGLVGRKQYSIDVIVSRAVRFSNVYKQAFIEAISESCGGCTVINSDGYWSEEAGEGRKDSYSTANKEHNLHVQLTVEPEKFARTYAEIQGYCLDLQEVYPDIKWVHVTVKEIIGLHFNVQEV